MSSFDVYERQGAEVWGPRKWLEVAVDEEVGSKLCKFSPSPPRSLRTALMDCPYITEIDSSGSVIVSSM